MVDRTSRPVRSVIQFHEHDGSTHPNVVIAFAHCKRELATCDASSNHEKREKEWGDMVGHLAKDDAESGDEGGKGRTDPGPVAC